MENRRNILVYLILGIGTFLRFYHLGKLCFWCPVDIQNTMIKGTVEDVKNYAKKLIDYFGKFNGGFIAKWYPSPEAVNHSWEKIDAMAETFIEYGKVFYKRKVKQ